MKLISTILGAVAIAWPFSLHAAGIPVAPVSNWGIDAKAGDKVALSGDSKILVIDYDVKVDSYRLVGHKTNTEAAFTVLLKKPLKLSREDARICFDAMVSGSAASTIMIRPLIEDSEGEKLSYVARATPSVAQRPKGEGWVSWKTQEFHTTEAGGSAQDIFASESESGNAWPDGDLRFLGFQVRVYADATRKATGQRSGRLLIANVATGGMRVTEQPFVFLDALLSEKGEYQLSYETRAEFQGKPLFDGSRKITFDPADKASGLQRFVFPIGELHQSWLRYRVTDASGKIVADNERRWDQDIAPGKETELKPVDLEKEPAVGRVRFNPLRPGGAESVYKEDEPFTVGLRVFPPGAEPVRLEWTLRQYAFKTELGKGEKTIAGSQPYTDVTLELPKEASRDAYKLGYRLVNAAGATIDQGECLLGIAHAEIAPCGAKTGLLPDRNEIKKYPYFRTTFVDEHLKRNSEEDVINNFREMIRQSSQITQHLTYTIDLSELEVLPGVYDFALCDRIMDTAADHGVGLTVRLSHMERDAPFRWAPYTLPRNFDGASLTGHVGYGSYAATDPGYVDLWHRGFKALHDRYRKHPAFEGYYVMQPGGEWPLPDEPYAGNIADYSWSAKAAFRTYLKEHLKLDLASLNARWKTRYKGWDEVEPPQPSLLKGRAPDLRPQWIDFNYCKLEWRDSWFELIGRRIRSYDSTRVNIAYAGRQEDLNRFYGLYDYLHNGGNDDLEDEGFLLEGWKRHKLGYITEPHHPHFWAAANDPAQRGWILDWSLYVMTAQAGGGGQNLHVYYSALTGGSHHPYSLVAHYGTVVSFDRMETFKPILRELHDFELIRPAAQVAVIQDKATMITKHRTTFAARMDDLRRWFKLLLRDSVDYEFYQPKNEANYKLVVVNPLDEVMTKESIEAVSRMASNGAVVCISARSGRYSLSDGEKNEYALLGRLGISKPKGLFDTAQRNIAAKLEPGQTLFKDRASIPFYTQADMRDELRKPETGANFWNWSYRWLPQTDYFGFFPQNNGIDGEVIARFPDGGAALTRHQVGKGSVLVFWGTPDMQPERVQGMMASIAQSAGVVKPGGNRPIPLMLQGKRQDVGRYYALVYEEKAGTYRQPISCLPDGDWFVEDLVSARRFGYIKGELARTEGLKLTFESGQSPLKVLRFTDRKKMAIARWHEKFGRAEESQPAQ